MTERATWAALAVGGLVGYVTAVRGAGEKAQAVRLVDVFILGPLLAGTGFSRRAVPSPILRAALTAAGAATVTYNAVNYLKQRREE